MTLVYMLKLDFKICHVDIKICKINNSIFKMFEIVLASFQIKDKLEKAQFFHKIFLLADTSLEIMLNILF